MDVNINFVNIEMNYFLPNFVLLGQFDSLEEVMPLKSGILLCSMELNVGEIQMKIVFWNRIVSIT